ASDAAPASAMHPAQPIGPASAPTSARLQGGVPAAVAWAGPRRRAPPIRRARQQPEARARILRGSGGIAMPHRSTAPILAFGCFAAALAPAQAAGAGPDLGSKQALLQRALQKMAASSSCAFTLQTER